MTKEDAKKHINEQEPTFLPRARTKGYVCPVCKNGTGTDGTGLAEKYNGHHKCFRCGLYAEVIELYGLSYNKDRYYDRLEGAAAYYGVYIDRI